MNIVVVLIILLLLFGGGGFYMGGPLIGGGLGGLILLVLIVTATDGQTGSPGIAARPDRNGRRHRHRGVPLKRTDDVEGHRQGTEVPLPADCRLQAGGIAGPRLVPLHRERLPARSAALVVLLHRHGGEARTVTGRFVHPSIFHDSTTTLSRPELSRLKEKPPSEQSLLRRLPARRPVVGVDRITPDTPPPPRPPQGTKEGEHRRRRQIGLHLRRCRRPAPLFHAAEHTSPTRYGPASR